MKNRMLLRLWIMKISKIIVLACTHSKCTTDMAENIKTLNDIGHTMT